MNKINWPEVWSWLEEIGKGAVIIFLCLAAYIFSEALTVVK